MKRVIPIKANNLIINLNDNIGSYCEKEIKENEIVKTENNLVEYNKGCQNHNSEIRKKGMEIKQQKSHENLVISNIASHFSSIQKTSKSKNKSNSINIEKKDLVTFCKSQRYKSYLENKYDSIESEIKKIVKLFPPTHLRNKSDCNYFNYKSKLKKKESDEKLVNKIIENKIKKINTMFKHIQQSFISLNCSNNSQISKITEDEFFVILNKLKLIEVAKMFFNSDSYLI